MGPECAPLYAGAYLLLRPEFFQIKFVGKETKRTQGGANDQTMTALGSEVLLLSMGGAKTRAVAFSFLLSAGNSCEQAQLLSLHCSGFEAPLPSS